MKNQAQIPNICMKIVSVYFKAVKFMLFYAPLEKYFLFIELLLNFWYQQKKHGLLIFCRLLYAQIIKNKMNLFLMS